MTWLQSLGVRAIAIIAAALLLLAVVTLGPAACNRIRSMGAQQRLQESQAEAQSNSTRDAIGAQGAAAARERASEDLGRTNEEEIRNAKGSDAPVDPAARDAGLRALCRRDAYRDRPGCRLQPVNP